MDKELINRTWSCLPKEFKEEVKKSYRYYSCMAKDQYDCGIMDCIETIFGKHNLTSDAEGEEMLTVEANLVKELYQRAKEIEEESKRIYSPLVAAKYRGVQRAIEDLFGSKCLLDDVDSSEPKPAEPKFTKEDMVHCKSFGYEGDYKVIEYVGGSSKCYDCIDRNGYHFRFYESDLEPYTEPEEPTCTRTCTDDCPSQSRNLSQETANCDKCNDRRLHIAAMAMQGIMSASDPLMFSEKGCLSAEAIARQALKYAEALIAESEKGGRNEKV